MNKQPDGWLIMKNENIIWLCQEPFPDRWSRVGFWYVYFFFLSISNTPDDILEPKQWKKWIEMQNNWIKKTNNVAAFFRGAMLSFCAENTTEMSLVSMQTLAFHTKYQCKSQTNICAIFFSVCNFFSFHIIWICCSE